MYRSTLKLIFASISIFVSIVSVILLFINDIQAQTYNFPGLIDKIAAESYSSRGNSGLSFQNVTAMDGWVSSQNEDGSWNNSSFNNHIWRLWYLAGASSRNNHSKYNDTAYKNAVKKGLKYWYESNTTHSNWWFNKIFYPQKLGEVLIFMREFSGFIPFSSATEIDETKILSLFIPSSIEDITSHGAGANAMDIALHYVYRAILTEDIELLENTSGSLQGTLANNIKGDFVMHDHGPQIQIGSYGRVLADVFTLIAYYLADTPAAFDLNNDNVNKVIRFIRETQISSVRGGTWDFSVLGRSVSRPNGTTLSLNYLKRMANGINPASAAYYLDAVERVNGDKPANYNIREFNKHYWASDYTQHARDEFLFTVRNVSTRTVEAENGNEENLKANYFSYGATFMSIDGSEYPDIMPIWDWSMIPGTTFPHTNNFPERPQWGANYGNTSFVGGVSNSTYGSAVLDLDEAGVTAKKSWFFFEDEIVCLGAGITDNSGNNVRTTVNQYRMAPSSHYKEVGDANETIKTHSTSTYENSNLEYIRHGNFGYYFPEQGKIKFTMKTQSGSWYDINHNQSDQVLEGDVFTLWFDHGNNPVDEKYSYIVVPGIDSEEKAMNYDMTEIEIVENTEARQAVYHKTLDLLQVIFHEAGTIEHNGRSIFVSQPCALMLENGTLVTIADPVQTIAFISVKINVNNSEYKEFIAMPTSTEMRGSSVAVDFGIPTNTNNHQESKNLKISFRPNPSKGIFHVTTGNQELLNIEVINIYGQVIINERFNEKTTIDITEYPNGIYFIKATNREGKIHQQKLIKY